MDIIPEPESTAKGLLTAFLTTIVVLILLTETPVTGAIYQTIIAVVALTAIVTAIVLEYYTKKISTYLISVIAGVPLGYLFYILLWMIGIIPAIT